MIWVGQVTSDIARAQQSGDSQIKNERDSAYTTVSRPYRDTRVHHNILDISMSMFTLKRYSVNAWGPMFCVRALPTF